MDTDGLKAENESLRSQLAEKDHAIAQRDAALEAMRSFKEELKSPAVAVPIRNVPSEGTPLVAPAPAPVRRSSSAKEVALKAKDNKEAAAAGGTGPLGFGFAIACLLIYYLNGGDSAECSTKLPLFLKVNGYASIAYVLAAALLAAAAAAGDKQKSSQSLSCVSCLVGLTGCFLFSWLICGLVWFFGTSSAECDTGMYKGAKIYFIVAVAVPLACCCCCGCCAAAVFAKAGNDMAGAQEVRAKKAVSVV